MDARCCNGWGEAPERDLSLEVPFFLTPEWKRTEERIAEAEAARVAAAVGRERRKLRQEERLRRNRRIGAAIVPVLAMLLIFAEFLCR